MAEAIQIRCPHCGQDYSVPPEQAPQYLGQTIVCQNCRRPFAVHGTPQQLETSAVPTGAGGGPPGPPGQPSPPAYSGQPAFTSPRRTDGMSIAALVSGILALFIPIIAGLAAIIFGILGMKRTADPQVGGRGLALAGLVLGIIGLVISTCMIAVLLPALNRAREAAQTVACASNLRQIGVAIMMYQTENHGYFPPDLSAVLEDYLIDARVFVCPASDDSIAPGPSPQQQARSLLAGPHLSYIYVHPGRRVHELTNPGSIVIAYEPLEHHGRGSNFLFADFSVEFLPRDEAQRMIREVQAE